LIKRDLLFDNMSALREYDMAQAQARGAPRAAGAFSGAFSGAQPPSTATVPLVPLAAAAGRTSQ
jgi:hypothetical protein